jgi:hypothetical protein
MSNALSTLCHLPATLCHLHVEIGHMVRHVCTPQCCPELILCRAFEGIEVEADGSNLPRCMADVMGQGYWLMRMVQRTYVYYSQRAQDLSHQECFFSAAQEP